MNTIDATAQMVADAVQAARKAGRKEGRDDALAQVREQKITWRKQYEQDIAKAVQAEHEATMADVVEGFNRWYSMDPVTTSNATLMEHIVDWLEVRYRARTNPPPGRVTVEMDTDFYSKMVLARSPWLARMTLLDPSETEKSDSSE